MAWFAVYGTNDPIAAFGFNQTVDGAAAHRAGGATLAQYQNAYRQAGFTCDPLLFTRFVPANHALGSADFDMAMFVALPFAPVIMGTQSLLYAAAVRWGGGLLMAFGSERLGQRPPRRQWDGKMKLMQLTPCRCAMIHRTLSLVVLLFLANLARGETFVYISVAAEKRIAVYQLDGATGKLTHRSDCQVTDGEPGALTVDPEKRFLLAAIRSTGKLASFRLDAGTGKLTHVNTVVVGPDPAQVATDRSGRFLLTAYYVDARVTVHAIGKDGALSDKPIESLPTADKAHAIVPDPSNRFVFVPHTGPNAIFQFAFDAKTGRLAASKPAKLQTPKNSGPRHLVFHPSRPIAYVDNEQGSGITSYAFDDKTGTLTPLQTLSTLPADFKGTNACAEIKLHPTGRFAYVSNRGHDSIAAFAIDGDGKMSPLGQFPTEKTPRSFDIVPSGNYLFAAGESSGKLAGYRVDARSGELTRFSTYDVGKMPWWVMAVDVTR